MVDSLPRPPLALVVATSAALVVLVLALIGVEVGLVALASESAERFPEYGHLRVPILTLAISFVVSVQAALVSIGVLILRVRSGLILTSSSVRWVDILSSLAAGIALLMVIGAVLFSANAGHPGLVLGLLLGILVLGAVAGVTLVLRSLLRGSIVLRAELDEVV